MKKFLIIPIIVFAIACSSSKQVVDVNAFTATNPLIKMSKTKCYGRCPVYSLEINGLGEITLEGEENLDKIGSFKLIIPKEEVAELVGKFETADFWNLDDEYDARVTDLPSTYITLNYQGKSKKIKCRYNIPEELTKLENLLSEYLERDGWRKM